MKGKVSCDDLVIDKTIENLVVKSYLMGRLARGVSVSEEQEIYDKIDELNGIKKVYVVKNNIPILLWVFIIASMNLAFCLWIIFRLGLM